MTASENERGKLIGLSAVPEKSGHSTLRGDYAKADRFYVVDQNWQRYTPDQHALWRRLYARQSALLPGRACNAFIDHLSTLDAASSIPDFLVTSEALHRATGWRLVAVPGLVPDDVFFTHLAARRFPVTVWLREPHEFEYIVEPDIFHDFFGHVPLLFNPIFADHLQAYGAGGLKALPLGGLPFLARLYWYTIEFGLIDTADGLRVYGAGLLSSGGEISYCLESPVPLRVPFDVERVMLTLYKIDSFQQSYFVIQDFGQLFTDTARDFEPLYALLKMKSPLSPDKLLPGETSRDISGRRGYESPRRHP